MAFIRPARNKFLYKVYSVNGHVFTGQYEDGSSYYNIIAMRVGATSVNNPHRIVARCNTLENARALVDALTKYTA